MLCVGYLVSGWALLCPITISVQGVPPRSRRDRKFDPAAIGLREGVRPSGVEGAPTFIRLLKAWQPEAWSSFKDPVCRLVKALYGDPRARDFWHDSFQAELIKLEFKTIDGWPSVYVRELNNNDRIIICVCVDDLAILGPKAMYPVLKALRKEIEMDGLRTLNKYLGCFHHFLETTVNGEKLMTIQFDMADYFKARVKSSSPKPEKP